MRKSSKKRGDSGERDVAGLATWPAQNERQGKLHKVERSVRVNIRAYGFENHYYFGRFFMSGE